MPRPSLKEERRTAILEAYGRCVARYGVEGATLERTAEEADLARALIRHNVGNKDELLDAFLDQFLGGGTEATSALFGALPKNNRIPTMVKWLFDPQYSDAHEISVTSALIVAAIERPALAKRLRQWTYEFIDRVKVELIAAFPEADDEQANAVAIGITAIYFNVDTLTPLGDTERLRQSSEAAVSLLISTLGRSSSEV